LQGLVERGQKGLEAFYRNLVVTCKVILHELRIEPDFTATAGAEQRQAIGRRMVQRPFPPLYRLAREGRLSLEVLRVHSYQRAQVVRSVPEPRQAGDLMSNREEFKRTRRKIF
jgi:hypothetical protein